MRYSLQCSLLLVSLSVPVVSAERVLGAYIYSRHGDRTAKVFGSTQLTDLGYHEVFESGTFYHDRYIASGSEKRIEGISEYVVNSKQISASAPSDAVLQNSATGFLQGVYPPVGSHASQTLGNGTTVESPLNGYQLIQLSITSENSDSEDSTWLQGSSDCQKAGISSNDYYASDPYNEMLKSTQSFYQSLSPMLNRTFNASSMSFKNAYTIFDYLNVGRIHNSSAEFPNESQLTDEVYQQLLSLASIHEYNLAYNSSDPVRAIDGAVLVGQILSALNDTITSEGKSKLTVGFGSYGTFFSFFALMQLPAASVDFTGVPDYASTMVLELVTNATDSDFPSSDEISVRFLWHNGTVTGSDEPTTYPLFSQSNTLLPWSEFASEMKKIAVLDTNEWCQVCGNTDGKCASTSSSSSGSASASAASSGGGMSRGIAGVIGAMVTLAVILGLEALFFLVGGFRIIKRRKTVTDTSTPAAINDEKSS
ncbi:uncharacterized protein N7459_010090 [Penicillium hispanicum]|uniref:uncharacterized protein n=1 Tax=Penicillium hispanicum TaxID=1080232 RepID=UPI0025414232|nr:uncharacterized protein N7459_010090 [Penicillium hispanicum]KAJ5566708.1 hypothetical protein N7459_010090 [Penicillium hispanicum]